MKFTVTIPKIKINLKAIDIRKLVDHANAELQNTLLRLRQEIGKGTNANGGPIRASGYSPGYLAAMQRGTVKRNGVRKPYTETVNLTISGLTLNSFQTKKNGTGDGAELFINSTEGTRIAAALHDRGFTGWFEYGRTDLDRIEKSFDREINKMVRNLIDK